MGVRLCPRTPGVYPLKNTGEVWKAANFSAALHRIFCSCVGLLPSIALFCCFFSIGTFFGIIRVYTVLFSDPGGLLPESFDGYNIIEKDDIVIRLTDLQKDHKSLRVGLSPERGIVTSSYDVTVRNYSHNLAEYLYYYLHSYDVAKGFYGMGAGVRQGLNWDGLKNLQITIPTRLP